MHQGKRITKAVSGRNLKTRNGNRPKKRTSISRKKRMRRIGH